MHMYFAGSSAAITQSMLVVSPSTVAASTLMMPVPRSIPQSCLRQKAPCNRRCSSQQEPTEIEAKAEPTEAEAKAEPTEAEADADTEARLQSSQDGGAFRCDTIIVALGDDETAVAEDDHTAAGQMRRSHPNIQGDFGPPIYRDVHCDPNWTGN